MRVVVCRVLNASCIINNQVHSKIDKGLLLLVGFSKDDEQPNLEYIVKKVSNLRIFEDDNQKMNLSVKDVGGEILSVSQFTLYADCKKGNRPSFINALNPDLAIKFYDQFNELLNKEVNVKTGVFGADMKLDFINDGPVTIILEDKNENNA